MINTKIEKQDVTAKNPLQYKFTTYKTVKDINDADVQIVDTVEIKNTVELNVEIVSLNKQITDLQSKVIKIKDRLVLIANY